MLYVPTWDKQKSLDLKTEFSPARSLAVALPGDQMGNQFGTPENNQQVRGSIGRPGSEGFWQRYWLAPMRPKGMALTDGSWHDEDQKIKRSFPVMSLFGAIAPTRNPNRIDLLRRGGRELDVSHALSAGELVVLAESEGPLPIPLDVEGDKVAGNGTIFYQYVLPVDRSTPTGDEEDAPEPTGATTAPAPTPASDDATVGPERAAP